MMLEDMFHRFAVDNCTDTCGKERHLTFSYRVNHTGRREGSGNYNHRERRVRITLGNDVADNICTMLHELAHHIVMMRDTYSATHGYEFWRTYFGLLSKYEPHSPGLFASEIKYHGVKNGIWLHAGMSLNVPGTHEVWQELIRRNDERNKYIKETNSKIAARTTQNVAHAMFANFSEEE